MFHLRRPTDVAVRELLRSQAQQSLTYGDVGATASTALPRGYNIDRTRIMLGRGNAMFWRAKTALAEWRQVDLGWLRALPPKTPLQAGNALAVTARTFGVWSMNANRIVYTIDEPSRFGFAYGTLPHHAETGEERFLVEQSPDGSVWYDILAFSRPRHPLAKLGYPIVRRLQKQFGRESAAAMLHAVGSAGL